MQLLRAFSLVAIVLTLTGCSISQTVDPLKPAHISQVCILDNPKILMDGFQPELKQQIEAKAILTRVFSGARPTDCSHYLEYTANWQWDMAMYLTYAEFRIYDTSGLAGQAVYNARNGGGRLDKFGRTAEKIRPLIDQLFASTTIGPVLVPTTAKATPSPPSPDRTGRLKELQSLHEQGLITDEEMAAKRQAILGEI